MLAICITPANPTTSNLPSLYEAGVNCREKRMEHTTTDSGKGEGQSKVRQRGSQWCGRSSWLQLEMAVVMLSISNSTVAIDCNGIILWSQKYKTVLLHCVPNEWSSLRSKSCTIAVYSATYAKCSTPLLTWQSTAPPTYGPTHQLKLPVVPQGSAPAAQLWVLSKTSPCRCVFSAAV